MGKQVGGFGGRLIRPLLINAHGHISRHQDNRLQYKKKRQEQMAQLFFFLSKCPTEYRSAMLIKQWATFFNDDFII